MRRLHLVVFVVLIALSTTPVRGAAPGSVSGLVCDSAGVPQIGAVVQLLRPDLTVIASVYTNSDGRFLISSLAPGQYALKAMNTSFLPSLRENIRVRAGTVVNLTLSTLYEVMQWLPSEPRSVNAQQDDWKWTLRSAANRPLLRWLEDGPLVVVSDGSGAAPKLKARLMATGQQGTFGESGERISAAVQETPNNSRELLAHVDFSPDSDAGMESMLGFRQDLGFAGSVESVAAIAIHPEIENEATGADGTAGLDEAAFRSWEDLNLGDALEAEVGSTQMVAHLAGQSLSTLAAVLPYAQVGWRSGDSTVRYKMATFTPDSEADETQAQAWMPKVAVRNGNLVVERGMHQELGWERHTEHTQMTVMVFADRVKNPILEASDRIATNGAGPSEPSGSEALFDPTSGLLHAAGPDYTSTGMTAAVVHQLSGGNLVRVSYATGESLAMEAGSRAASLEQAVAAAHTRRAQAYSLSLSGTLEGTGTRWQASYLWQPEDTVTRVASYSADGTAPYLSMHFSQPIHARRDGIGGFEALLDLRNLLAEGYRPYVLSDGSVVVFAQGQRAVQGGLAFTF
jgi:hypothetical protein